MCIRDSAGAVGGGRSNLFAPVSGWDGGAGGGSAGVGGAEDAGVGGGVREGIAEDFRNYTLDIPSVKS